VILAKIDTTGLGEVILYSLVAGVGVTIVFALAVYGATRSTDMRRAGNAALATVYAIVAALGASATLGAIAFGIYLVQKKG
jgi:hypothetical protein